MHSFTPCQPRYKTQLFLQFPPNLACSKLLCRWQTSSKGVEEAEKRDDINITQTMLEETAETPVKGPCHPWQESCSSPLRGLILTNLTGSSLPSHSFLSPLFYPLSPRLRNRKRMSLSFSEPLSLLSVCLWAHWNPRLCQAYLLLNGQIEVFWVQAVPSLRKMKLDHKCFTSFFLLMP